MTKLAVKPRRIIAPEGKPLRLDLGCGDNKNKDCIGIDIVPTDSTDYVLDLRQTPWPIDSGSVESIWCSHFFEHLSGPERMPFMDECWRVLKPGCQISIIVPYWTSMRCVQDPTHAWPPVCESSFLYFNKKWREDNKLSHYQLTCDFDFGYGYVLDPDITVRNDEFKQFAVKNYNNTVHDLHVTLTKRA